MDVHCRCFSMAYIENDRELEFWQGNCKQVHRKRANGIGREWEFETGVLVWI